MDQKKLLLLVGAGVIALTTGLAAKAMFSGAAAPVAHAIMTAAPKGPRVLVAQRALPVGTIITADAIGYQPWPKDMVRDAYFLDGSVDMNKLLGTVVRFPVTAGQPLTQGALVAPGDRGFLAAALSPGMRAITIPVSDKSSVAGFVFPGDHVDVMLTQTVHGTGTDSAQPLNVTETILRNLRVLATDQSSQTDTQDGKTVVKPFHTVTLEVTPKIAEQISVAQSVGTLDLTLRSIADTPSTNTPITNTGMSMVNAGGPMAKRASSNGPGMTQLFNSSNQESSGPATYATGGDVSHFQRHSMPSMQNASPAASIPHMTGGVNVIRGNVVATGTSADAAVQAMGTMANNIGNAGTHMPAAIAPGV